MSKQDDRSEAALRERLEIAGKATKGPWAFWEWKNGVMEIRSNADPDEAHVCRVWNKEDGEFLRANSPREVRADIEEILRLRKEVARLDKEADWFIEYIWNKDIFRCPMPEGYRCEHRFKHVCCLDSEDTEIRGRCWREVARKAVEEQND